MSKAIKAIYELPVEVRINVGRGASRRLRRKDNKIPAIVYGAGQKSIMVSLSHNLVSKALENEGFYSHILTLKIDNKPEQVVLKDLQRHPYKKQIVHMDFLRIRADEELEMLIPLHFVGEEQAPGVKIDGGVIQHHINEVEVRCLPANLPEYIEVDVSPLALHGVIHLSDLKLPDGVKLALLIHEGAAATHYPVVSIHEARVIEEPVVGAPEQPVETEILTEKKKEEGAEGASEAEGKEAKKEAKPEKPAKEKK